MRIRTIIITLDDTQYPDDASLTPFADLTPEEVALAGDWQDMGVDYWEEDDNEAA
jgi:hypothetical protein